MKPCKWCKAAVQEFGHMLDSHVFTVVVDGESREVVMWTDHVHVSCEAGAVEAAKHEGATLWPRREA